MFIVTDDSVSSSSYQMLYLLRQVQSGATEMRRVLAVVEGFEEHGLAVAGTPIS